jgi:hypothetical protein
VNSDLKSTQNGELKDGTTETHPASQSSSAESQSTSVISDTTAKAKNPKASLATPNLQDIPNAVRLIQALAAKLGKLVEWKRLKLGDGEYVFALCFPVSKWEVDPASKELKPR